jgi:large repetitive protein
MEHLENVTYSLNGGAPQTSNTFGGLPGGTYTILVEDENGCSVLTEVITISNPTQIEAEIIVILSSFLFRWQ